MKAGALRTDMAGLSKTVWLLNPVMGYGTGVYELFPGDDICVYLYG
jgi:hypothetical protein